MNKEISKYLTEAMGICYHEYKDPNSYRECGLCHESTLANRLITDYNPSFTAWGDFGKLFTWAKEQGWWIDFVLDQAPGISNFCERLTPEKFAINIHKFLRRTRCLGNL